MIEDGSNGSGDSGNTKRVSPAKSWCFTFNNYTEKDINTIKQICSDIGSKFIVGLEVGEECGTPHLQGYIKFLNKVRPMSVFNYTNKISWRKCKGTMEENIRYCSKDNNYFGNLKPPKKLKIITDLYPWQSKLEEILMRDPDERNIYWIFDEIGNCGKSAFAKRLCANNAAVVVEGKNKDILYCAAEFESDIYLFDFPRTMEGSVNYGAVEKIKNGLYMSSKYESRPVVRNSPHVVIFANFRPDRFSLSLDRWKVYHINDETKDWEFEEHMTDD